MNVTNETGADNGVKGMLVFIQGKVGKVSFFNFILFSEELSLHSDHALSLLWSRLYKKRAWDVVLTSNNLNTKYATCLSD